MGDAVPSARNLDALGSAAVVRLAYGGDQIGAWQRSCCRSILRHLPRREPPPIFPLGADKATWARMSTDSFEPVFHRRPATGKRKRARFPGCRPAKSLDRPMRTPITGGSCSSSDRPRGNSTRSRRENRSAMRTRIWRRGGEASSRSVDRTATILSVGADNDNVTPNRVVDRPLTAARRFSPDGPRSRAATRQGPVRTTVMDLVSPRRHLAGAADNSGVTDRLGQPGPLS